MLFESRLTERLRVASALSRRHRAVGVALEPLEQRILFTWQGALTGNTFDASHTYNLAANWSSGAIEDSFAGITLLGNTTLYVNAAHTTGAGGLNLGYSGNFTLTIVAANTTAETLTLGGDISAGPTNTTVTLGDVTNTDDLNIALGAASRTFNTASGQTLDIANVVSNAHAVTAAGTGTLTLSGTNTFSGGTTLSSGQLDINSARAVGTGALTINGGTIDNTSGSAVAYSSNITQTWGADFTFLGSSSLSMGTGAVTLSASRILTISGSTLTEGGIISGAGFSLTKTGAGALALTGANTFTGGTILSAGQLDLNNPKAPGTGRLTINGGTIDNTSGALITLSNNNVQTWGADYTFVGSNALNFGTGAVTLGAARTVTVTASTLTEGGAIGDSGSGFSFTKAGAGILLLSGANTFSGGTTLSAGQLDINSTTAIGTGTFTISGGTIDNTTAAAITLTGNDAQSWNGGFTFVGTKSLNLGTGAVTLGGSLTVTVTASTLTAGGAIGDGGNNFSLSKSGAGTLTLTASGTYGGGTILNAGILSFANGALGAGNLSFAGSSTLQWNGANTQDVSSVIQAIGSGVVATFDTNGNNVTLASALSGAGSIAKIGAGTLTLSGTNTYQGGATLTTGQININSATALGTGTFAIGAGTTIDNTSAAAITLSNNNAQTWGGSFTFTGTKNLNFGTGAVTMSAAVTITTTAGALAVGGAIGDGGSAFLLTKAGGAASSLTLSGSNTYSGGLKLTAGVLLLGSATAVGTGTFTINGGTIDNVSGSAMTLTNNNASAWGASFTFTGSSDLNLGTGAVTLGAAVMVTTTNAHILAVGGGIVGAHTLTKAGAGTLTLSGNNTFSTGLTLSAGQLNLNSATAAGTGTITISGGTIDNTSGSAVILSSNDAQTWGANFTFTGSSDLNLGTGAVTLSASVIVTANGGTLAVGGGIVGAHALTKTGAGALTLSGNNTFSTGLTLTAGQLNVNSATALGAGTVAINGGTIDNTSGGTITITTTNAETWGGDFTFIGTSNLNLGTGAVTLSANRIITTTTGNLTVGGIISGAHSLAETGTGTVTLSGVNTYSLGTTLSSGQLNLNNAAALGTAAFTINGGTIDNTSGSAVTLNNNAETWGGDFTFAGSSALNLGTGAITLGASRTVTVSGSTLTVGGVIGGAGDSITMAGAGTLTLTGNNTFSGGVTINAGTVAANNAAGSATGTGAVAVNNTATLSGTGTASGAVTVNSGGTLAPGGASTSIFNTGNLILASGSNLDIVLNGNTAGSGYDQVNVTGTVDVTGSNVIFSGTRTAHDGTLLTIINNDAADAVTGTFQGIAEGGTSVFSGVTYAFTYQGGSGNDIVLTANPAATTTALAPDTNPSVFGQSVTLTAMVSTSATGTPTGSVTFMDGATTLGTGTLNGSDVATLATSALSFGSHSITAVYGGDTNFATSTSSTLMQTVNQAATTSAVVSSANPSVSGQSVTFTATIAATAPGAGVPTGSVTFMDGVTTLGTRTLDGSGQTTFSTSALSVASHSITIVYAGDTDFTTSTSSTLTQTVNQAATTSSVASSANPSVSGQSVTFTATVAATAPGTGTPTGSVTFKDGATTLGTGTLDGSGQTTFSTSALSVGSHSITVVYAGDTDFTTSTSSTLTQTVNQSATTSSVASSANPSVSGQSITFTATVAATAPGTGTPTGSVTFKDGATTLGTGTLDGSGQTTFSTSALSVGSHSITVIYAGDTDFTTSTSSTLTQTVDQSATTSSVSSSANPSVSGQSITFTATVAATAPGTGTPTGSVTFKDGATTLGTGTLDGSGQTTFSTSALSVASHSITVVYAGDTDFTTSTSTTLTQTVNQAATTSSVASSTNPTAFGESVTFTATITATAPGAGTPTGSVTFKDGATTLGTGTLDGSGQTTFSTSALSVGSHSITVVYAGDTNFVTSTSSTLTQTVNQSATTSSVASSANPSVSGQSVTFTATVAATAPGAGVPTGSVTFLDGATTLGTGTLDGSGQTTFSTSALSVASHSITVVYGGDTDFTTSTSSTLTQTVNQAATTSSVASSANPSVSGQSVTFTATVAATAPGTGTPTGSVTFKDGATTLGTGTLDGSGQTTFSTSALSVGSHSITVIYAGDTNFTTSTSSTLTQTVNQAATTSSVSSSANPSVFGQSVTFTATIAATAPGSGTPTGSVTFKDGATTLGTGTLDGSGQTTLSTSTLLLGSNSITVIYGADTDFTTSTSSALTQTVGLAATTSSVASSANPSVFGQSVTFTATVAVTGLGMGIPTGTVTFMDGAITLGTGTLNGSGQTTLSTSALLVGGHSITVVYAGDTNFITSTSSTLTQTVNQAATTSSVASSANPSVSGQSVTFTATVAATAPGAGIPTGSVTFMDGVTTLGTGTLDGSGQTTFSTSALSHASHSITVVYAGDTSFTTSTSSTLTQTVNQSATTTAIVSSAAPSVFGQSVTFTVTVAATAPGSGTPTGNVTFKDGSTILGTDVLDGSANATLTLSNLLLGSHSITAVYAGDTDFTTSTSSTLTQTVNQSATNSTVTSSVEPTAFSQSVTFTATVAATAPGAGTPTGSVTFMDGATTLGTGTLDGSGLATFSISTLIIGSHSITAVYGGDANFAGNTSAVFSETVVQTPPSKLVFDQQPTSEVAGTTIGPAVTVDVEDPFGNIVHSDTSNVTLSIAGGSGALLGTRTVTAVNGVATFNDLSVDIAGTYTLVAADAALAAGTSGTFTITPAAAAKLAFVQQPTTIAVGNPISPAVTVAVQDQFGNVVTTDNSNVTLSVASGASPLIGTLIVAATNGLASFSGLTLDTDGPYTLSAVDGSFTPATSNSFAVTTAGAPATLTVAQQPTTLPAGANPASALVIQIKDQYGNVIIGFDSDVTLSILTGPASGVLAGTPTVTAVNGVATFGDIHIAHAGTYVLAASINGGIVAESDPIQIDPGPATQNIVMQQPAPSWQYGAISPNVVINVSDQFGNPVPVAGATVTASLSSGPAGAILSGTLTVPAVAGQAVFNNLSVNLPGLYTLIFTSSGDSPAVTESFDVIGIPATRFLFNGSPISARSILQQQLRNAPIYINLGPPTVLGAFINAFVPSPSLNNFSAAPAVVATPAAFADALAAVDPDLLKKLLDSL